MGAALWHVACVIAAMTSRFSSSALAALIVPFLAAMAVLMVVMTPACLEGPCPSCAEVQLAADHSTSPLQPVVLPPLSAVAIWSEPDFAEDLLATPRAIGAPGGPGDRLSTRLLI
jgi:hypothetical protein